MGPLQKSVTLLAQTPSYATGHNVPTQRRVEVLNCSTLVSIVRG